jgi:hypothetical protein
LFFRGVKPGRGEHQAKHRQAVLLVAQFASGLSTAYSKSGAIILIMEIWNEPDLHCPNVATCSFLQYIRLFSLIAQRGGNQKNDKKWQKT